MADNSQSKRRGPGSPFAPGKSPNPGGRPKLDPEIKEMREAVLSKAVKILYARIHDPRYIAKLRPAELDGLLSMAFDRCGLPKVTQIEADVKETRRIVLIFPEAHE